MIIRGHLSEPFKNRLTKRRGPILNVIRSIPFALGQDETNYRERRMPPGTNTFLFLGASGLLGCELPSSCPPRHSDWKIIDHKLK